MSERENPGKRRQSFRARQELRWQLRIWRAALVSRASRHHCDAPVFIVGCGRSGTTIVGQVLAEHPAIAYLNEPRAAWIAACPATDIWTVLAPLRRGHLALAATDAHAQAARRLGRYFGHALHRQGGEQLVEKLPENALRLPFLSALFPQARYIHVWRNGVEVAQSIARKIEAGGWYGSSGYKWRTLCEAAARVPELYGLPFGELTPFERGLLEWRLSVELAEPFLAHLSPQQHIQVDYAALVESPATMADHLCDFLHLPHSPAMQAFAQAKVRRPRTPAAAAGLSERALAIGGRWLADGTGYT